MKFDASKDADPLEYDFNPYADAKGAVPEPSDGQVAAFYEGLSKQFTRALGEDRTAGLDPTDPLSVAELFQSLDADDHEKLYTSLLDLHAEVCSEQPTRAELEKLPFRIRRMFYGAVQGWLRPEGWKPATKD